MTQERLNMIRKHANEVYDSFDKLGANLKENESALSDHGKSNLYLWELANDKQPNESAQQRAAKTEKPTAVGEQTGGELAAAPCSAWASIAQFTGHEEKDFEGGWLSDCRQVMILPVSKIKTACHMHAQEKWRVLAVKDELVVLEDWKH